MILASAATQPPILSTPSGFGLLLGILAVMSVIPFLLTLVTSFAKFTIVLGLLRQALGTQQTPPNVIVTGIALILSIHVMWPVAEASYRNFTAIRAERTSAESDQTVSFDTLVDVARSIERPMSDFLRLNSNPAFIAQFAELGANAEPEGAPAPHSLHADLVAKYPELAGAVDGLVVLAPAFLLTELTEAFQIGFLLFVPFLVIDLVVGNVLLAMGMQMLSPQTIALPLKLLLFVLMNGWSLILTGLVQGYA